MSQSDYSRIKNFLIRRLTLPLFVLVNILTNIFGRDNKIWVFSDFTSTQRFSQNSRYLFQYLSNKSTGEVRPIWLTESPDLYKKLSNKGYEVYMANSIMSHYYTLRAEYIPIDSGPGPIPWWCTGGATVIQMAHGIPLKANKTSSTDSKLIRALSWNSADCAVFSSEYCENHYQAYIKSGTKCGFINTGLSDGNSIYTGYPKMDAIINSDIDTIDGIDTKPEKLGVEQSDLVIGYFPTVREGQGLDLIEIFDIDRTEQFLRVNNAKLLIKPHRGLDITRENFKTESIQFIPPDTDSHQLLSEIDILITDYSGVYFDFLLLDRPVVFYTPDYTIYEKVRGVHPNYENVTAGPRVETYDQLLTELKSIVNSSDEYNQQRQEVRDQFFNYADGEANKRVVSKLNDSR